MGTESDILETPVIALCNTIKYNRLNGLYSMANGPKEKRIEMGNTKRSRSQRERERIMSPCSTHA